MLSHIDRIVASTKSFVTSIAAKCIVLPAQFHYN